MYQSSAQDVANSIASYFDGGGLPGACTSRKTLQGSSFTHASKGISIGVVCNAKIVSLPNQCHCPLRFVDWFIVVTGSLSPLTVNSLPGAWSTPQ